MTPSTEVAQRRLLEALANLFHSPPKDTGHAGDGLEAFAVAVEYARQMAREADLARLEASYRALHGLVMAVRADLIDDTTQEAPRG